ncbi:MAG: hypothetical protein AAGC93_05780 [Cyanobacteria bacterium P01_F01_bin.53]
MATSEDAHSLLGIPVTHNGLNQWEGVLALEAWSSYGEHLTKAPFSQSLNTQRLRNESGLSTLYIQLLKEATPNPDGQQAAALEYFLSNQQTIEARVLQEIWRVVIECDKASYDNAVATIISADNHPEINAENDMTWEEIAKQAKNPTEAELQMLKSLMVIHTVIIFPGDEQVPVQLSLQFECAWDPDNGVEVLIEQDDIKEIDSIGGLTTCAWHALL